MASRQGLKHTPNGSDTREYQVASGMASRQGLKQHTLPPARASLARRQWNGFPSGIETSVLRRREDTCFESPVEWLPVRD